MRLDELNLTEATPGEIDAAWLEDAQPLRTLRERVHALRSTARKYRKYGGNYVAQGDRYDAQADELAPKVAEQLALLKPYDEEFARRGGWTRAYLVPDGHIHKSTACHTLHPTTLISWLPEQSGLDEEKIVELAGMMACTVCYPSAPVEALRAAAAEEKKKGQCEGSGQYAKNLKRYGQRYVPCHVCGASTSVTSRGNLRTHKAKVEVKV